MNPISSFYTVSTRSRGFSLVELMVVVAIAGILASLAIPIYSDAIARGHVRAAAESIYGLLLQASSEAPIRDTRLSVSIDTGSWCVGLSEYPGCDCTLATGAGACFVDVAGEDVLNRVGGSEYPLVTISETFPGVRTTFSHIRKNASPAGTITVSSRDQTLLIKVSLTGRIRICTLSGMPIAGYQTC